MFVLRPLDTTPGPNAAGLRRWHKFAHGFVPRWRWYTSGAAAVADRTERWL